MTKAQKLVADALNIFSENPNLDIWQVGAKLREMHPTVSQKLRLNAAARAARQFRKTKKEVPTCSTELS